MNERIRELAFQAKFAMDVSNDPNSPPSWWAAGHNDTFEKFAELIVRECIDCINETDKHYIFTAQDAGVIGAAHNRSIKTIKEHFGVEL
jgi:hypothetical protein